MKQFNGLEGLLKKRGEGGGAYGLGNPWVCGDAGGFMSDGRAGLCVRREGARMSVLLTAAVSAPLMKFAEGAVLAASVYLVSRGVKK